MQNCTATLKTSLAVSYKGKLTYPMTSTSAPMYHPREIKAYAHIKTYVQMLMETLFTIIKNWKQSKGPSAGECIMDKPTVEHPHNKIPFSNSKEQTTGTCNYIDKFHILYSKRCQRQFPQRQSWSLQLCLWTCSP